eukprot:COSAG05_NODE_7239_length_838_cov_3.930988_1_plen_114_part_00
MWPVCERVGARVEQANGGGAKRHEHHAAVGQQDSASELALSGGSDVRTTCERVGARVEQAHGGEVVPRLANFFFFFFKHKSVMQGSSSVTVAGVASGDFSWRDSCAKSCREDL